MLASEYLLPGELFHKAILASGVMLIHPGKSLVTLSLTSAGENPTWVEKETWDISLQ